MQDFVFITGNDNKARQLAMWVGRPIEHRRIDIDEIQSLDAHVVTEHKARAAYAEAGKPVLVEDVSLTFTALKTLPGPFIKWFETALGYEGLCRLLDGYKSRLAMVTVMYGLYDGQDMRFFEASMTGTIAEHPRGTGGFGFDVIFMNEGYTQTRAEMSETDYAATAARKQAVKKLADYLDNTDK